MKSIKAFLVAVAAALFIAGQASAQTITGDIEFGGRVSLDADFASATAVIDWEGPQGDLVGDPGLANVTQATGSFAGLTNMDVVIAQPWSFNSGAIDNFWTVGGFTFDLIASTRNASPNTFIIASGTGILSAAGFENTPGTWAFSTQLGGGTQFTFSASSRATPTPDGGATAVLLGLALAGIGLVRRKLKAS